LNSALRTLPQIGKKAPFTRTEGRARAAASRHAESVKTPDECAAEAGLRHLDGAVKFTVPPLTISRKAPLHKASRETAKRTFYACV
jgi:hypothetical protein